ncbi:MAG: HAD hydrolase-like protein [Gloeobacterales cyanobacterium]
MRLLLFDIDGTLIRARGVGKRAYLRTCSLVCGLPEANFYHADLNLAGKTDPLIIEEMLAVAGVKATPEVIEEILACYPRALRKELSDNPDIVQALPGMRELLALLEGQATLGLVTGNVRAGAELKLGPVQMNSFFSLGAYGCDARDRNRLPAIAVSRSKNPKIKPKDVIIIGDTPRDIACARYFGARVMAVATGSYQAPVLSEYVPDWLVERVSPEHMADLLLHA